MAFEATFGWGWFADLLAELGIKAHTAHPLATKAISSGRVKNADVDAKTLAHLLRTNLLPEGWIAPPAVREARRLVRMRGALVQVRAKLKAQVHAVLGEHGVQPGVIDLFSHRGRELLGQLQLPLISQSRLQACLRLIDEVSLEIVLAEREIQDTIKDDERLERLLPIPGIGPINAATILSEIVTSRALPRQTSSARGPASHRASTRLGLYPPNRRGAGTTCGFHHIALALDISVPFVDDSQADSQLCGSWRTTADIRELAAARSNHARTSADMSGCQKRGLQNRLRGAVEASWVGSIPIHPRQFPPR